MDRNGQVYFESPERIPKGDLQRYKEAERQEKLDRMFQLVERLQREQASDTREKAEASRKSADAPNT